MGAPFKEFVEDLAGPFLGLPYRAIGPLVGVVVRRGIHAESDHVVDGHHP